MKLKFSTSSQYWNDRYALSGNSGAGSYGRLANFKASILNEFIEKNNIKSVIEFGCGDGNQLSLAKYPKYIGVDIASTSIQLCKDKFSQDSSKKFYSLDEYDNNYQAELTLSLDVIYHLIEEDVYINYMNLLFNSSSKFVIIYSSNTNVNNSNNLHVKHRVFLESINLSIWKLKETICNIYPYNLKDASNTSFSDFYIFEKSQ